MIPELTQNYPGRSPGALDADSEAQLVQALGKLSATKTIVCFTHSEALTRAAGCVVLLADGKVAMKGPYDQLAVHIKSAQGM